ncbi:MAG: hypothetical protein QXO70_02795, partial [Candidatus Pacearchaeota archaeon]
MVHVKYIVKNGVKYGPYYYESYREGNKVKKRYLTEEQYLKLIKQNPVKNPKINKITNPYLSRVNGGKKIYPFLLIILLLLCGIFFILN